MHIETARFGTIEVKEDTLFTFPMGLLGFARLKKFFVLDHREDSPFKWLQSAEDGDLAFIISDPLYFKRDFHVKVRKSELGVVEPASEDDLVVSVIMTVPEDPQNMSANLLAPLIFNIVNRKAMQYVLTDARFPVKYYVMKAWQENLAQTPPDTELRSISFR